MPLPFRTDVSRRNEAAENTNPSYRQPGPSDFSRSLLTGSPNTGDPKTTTSTWERLKSALPGSGSGKSKEVPSNRNEFDYSNSRRRGLDLTDDDLIEVRRTQQVTDSLAQGRSSFRDQLQKDVQQGIADVTLENDNTGRELKEKINQIYSRLNDKTKNDSELSKLQGKIDKYGKLTKEEFGIIHKPKLEQYKNEYNERKAKIEAPFQLEVTDTITRYEQYSAASSRNYESTRDLPPTYEKRMKNNIK